MLPRVWPRKFTGKSVPSAGNKKKTQAAIWNHRTSGRGAEQRRCASREPLPKERGRWTKNLDSCLNTQVLQNCRKKALYWKRCSRCYIRNTYTERKKGVSTRLDHVHWMFPGCCTLKNYRQWRMRWIIQYLQQPEPHIYTLN